MAAAASPIVCMLSGKKLRDAIAQTKNMMKICVAKNHNFPIPNLDFDFLPVGIEYEACPQDRDSTHDGRRKLSP